MNMSVSLNSISWKILNFGNEKLLATPSNLMKSRVFHIRNGSENWTCQVELNLRIIHEKDDKISLRLVFKQSDSVESELPIIQCKLFFDENRLTTYYPEFAVSSSTKVDVFHFFYSWEDILSLVDEDTLLIKCDFKILSSFDQKDSEPKIDPYLSRHLETMQETANYADFTFVIGDNKLRVHKAILTARSPAFAKKIEECAGDTSLFVDDINIEVFKELLKFVYTGTISRLDELCFGLLKAAHECELGYLKDLSEQKLIEMLDIANVCDFLILAETCDAKVLKERAIHKIKRNKDAVVKTNGWMKMLEHKNLLHEIIMAL